MNLPSPSLNSVPSKVQPVAQKPAFGLRVAEIAALSPDGRTIIGQRRIPTLRPFDHAFAAFAQGTVFHTETGLLAVEDIQPGDWLSTAGGDQEQVVWIGSTTFAPREQGERMVLTRVMPDSFGVGRPESYLSFGSAARVLQTPPDLRATTGARTMMTPVNRFTDGTNVINVAPPTPIRLFHVATRRHTALRAGGLEVESYHPGHAATEGMSKTIAAAFMALFPHLEQLSEFGPMAYARAPETSSALR